MIKKINLKYLLVIWVFVFVLPFIYAEDRCCKQDNNDVICAEYPINEINNYCSSENIHFGLCEEISDCEIGCCFSEEGLCTSGSRKIQCENGGGVWNGDDVCNIHDCQKGCCKLGGQAFFTTEKNCEVKADFFGVIDREFESGIIERECILSVQAEESGACVLSENNCIFTKEMDCITKGGNFYIDYLCSNPELNTSCERQTYTKCVEGKDEIYWFDSCNNRENIYDMDKEKSWNNGMVLSKSNSCDLNSGNTASCGNCNRFENSICEIYRPEKDVKPNEGDYVCRDLSCNVEIYNTSVTKKNGESWCVYDGKISVEENEIYARDIVGSKHWKHICIKGEERIEPCSDYRAEICVQEDINENGTIFTNSECITNQWWDCLNFNTEKTSGITSETMKDLVCADGSTSCFSSQTTMPEACNQNPYCFYKPGSFFSGLCLPRYAPGFDLREETEDDKTQAEKICDIGSSTCTVIYVRYHYLDSYHCEFNCHCEKAGYAKEASDYCVSFGDCGAYVNYIGEFTEEGFTVSETPYLSESNKEDYISNSIPVSGEKIDKTKFRNAFASGPGDLDLSKLLGIGGKRDRYYESNFFGTLVLIGSLGWGDAAEEFMRFIGAKTKKEYVTSTCMPWQPPDGGLDCDLCNGNPMKPCSVYRCESLGKNCKFINEGTGHELCIDNNPDDNTAPRISFLEEKLSEDLSYETTADGVNIIDSSDERGCIQAFTELSFGIQTDEMALCKVSDISTVYSSDLKGMPEFFGGNNFLEINHTMNTTIQSIESLAYQYEVFTGNIEEIYGNLRYYIRCKDTNGNSNFNEYVVNMCVKPGPDLTPPYIRKTNPESDTYISYGKTEQRVEIWVNEPADCKYSNENKEYSEMENQMICFNEWDAKQTFGWLCTTILTGLSENSSSFYIKCKDQPWLDEDNESRNVMGGDVYNLIVSPSQLSIEDFKPKVGEEIIAGVEPVTINLQIKTAGGAENGKAKCKYNFLDNENYNYFFETDSIYHKQTFSSIMSGAYNINLRCIDVAGNVAENSTSFNVELDTQGPRITRIYYDGGLNIWTNEEAKCRYAFNKKTNWENATEMSGNGQVEHTADWQLKTYYVQCKDEYGNKGGKTIIRPYVLTS